MFLKERTALGVITSGCCLAHLLSTAVLWSSMSVFESWVCHQMGALSPVSLGSSSARSEEQRDRPHRAVSGSSPVSAERVPGTQGLARLCIALLLPGEMSPVWVSVFSSAKWAFISCQALCESGRRLI